MIKLTLIGDIMVESPFLEEAKREGGEYDFYPALAPLKCLFDESDYVIANLETPLAGEDAGYTSRIVSFNAPDSVAEAIKAIGVNAVSTANNHCLDRGFDGLERTLKVLDKIGLSHTGTYTKGFSGDRNLYFEIDGTRFALIAYTLSTNYGISDALPEGDTAVCVNNSRPLDGGMQIYNRLDQSYYDTLNCVKEILGRPLVWEETIKIKIAMGLPLIFSDTGVPTEEIEEYVGKIGKDYELARENADIVLFYPHVGGQFNPTPGKYSEVFLKRCMDLGFDGIFAAHSHTTQRAEYIDEKPCFYSLGNVTMSTKTFYQVPEVLPEYGLAVHLYIDGKKIEKTTVSMFKMVEDEKTPLKVVPVDTLATELDGADKEKLISEVKEVYKRVLGREICGEDIEKEYEL